MASEDDSTVMIPVGGRAELCVEQIGRRGDPSLLLIGAAAWSMDWWDDALCRRLADRGRLVVRYDARDTGRSTCYPPGSPGYTVSDMVTDAVSVLDALQVNRAHVVGLSMGGGIAQRLALAHRSRVRTLTVMSTSSIQPEKARLPEMSEDLKAVFADPPPEPDWTDRDAVVAYIVEGERPFAGPNDFHESHVRALARRVVDRSHSMAASLTNHELLKDGAPVTGRLEDLDLPSLVVHGTADPLFPPAHGRALARQLPDARLLELQGVGHQLPPHRTWDALVDALIEHTRDQ